MNSTVEFEDEGTGGGSFLAHIPAILLHRKWFLIIPAILLSVAGVAAAFLLPAMYRSTAVLLVESPQFPVDLGGSASAEIIDQRIAKVRQQVLSRPALIEMIEKFELYADERATKSLSEIVETMREAAVIVPMGGQIQQTAGKSTTIAFSMSFDYSDEIKAQAVAQELVERVLQIDSTKSAEQSANTVQFLTDQAQGLQVRMSELEGQISAIKANNGQILSSAGMTMLGGSGGSYEAQIAGLQRENAALNSQRDLTKTAATRDPVVASAEAQLAAVRAIFADSHPDVIFARQRLAEAKALAGRNVEKIPLDLVTSQIASNNAQIAALRSAQASDSARTSSVLNAQSRAPLILEQIAQLQQRLAGMNTQYQQVSAKLSVAQAALRIDNEQKGERLTVVDPPVIPDEPVFPDRLLLIAGGMAAGLALGFVLAFAVELILQPIRGLEAVKAVLGIAPLGAVPTIEPKQNVARKRWYQRPWRFGRRSEFAAD